LLLQSGRPAQREISLRSSFLTLAISLNPPAFFVLNFTREAHRVKPKKKFTVLIEQDEEGFYVATVPALRGCHTQAKTLDTLMKRVREVIQLCLETNIA
jgi:predicted RNase H-like HicB family nuclease